MIPKQLKLRNFLSYREVALDFDGLHVACVCGPNGAGKSSLLEAIAWCVWGQSRVSTEDDIVRQGAKEAQVSFCFVHDAQTYRIIRTRRRSQASTLEFQIQTMTQSHVRQVAKGAESSTGECFEAGSIVDAIAFKSLTQKGVRATQQYILKQIKIDYDTFVNAAYLRQGRADEFMLKRPGERKQVLADLLKLDHYDWLADQAKEQARQYKAQIPALETYLDQLDLKAASRSDIQQQHAQLSAQVAIDKRCQQQRKQQLKLLKQQQQQRLSIRQQLTLVEQQQQHHQSTMALNQTMLADAQRQLDEIESVLSQAVEIKQGYEALLCLREQEDRQTSQFQCYQQIQSEQLALKQQQNQQTRVLQQQVDQLDIQLAHLETQMQAALKTLEKKEEIAQHLATLRQAKQQLCQLDKTEAESAPLRQRFLQIQGQIEQAHTRLMTQIELLESQQVEITLQQDRSPELMQAATEVVHKLAHLEKRRTYQEDVRQKGIERRSFMERLQANQLNHELTLARLDRTLHLLEDPDKAHCPVCEQVLEGETWEQLRDRTLAERADVQDQIWAIREQLAVSEREIQVLRQEYRLLEDELAKYSPILEEKGQLTAKLASVAALQERLQQLTTERSQLERCLQENDYATALQEELQQIEHQLAAMAYDDRDHALVRSQVDRLRWSELKQAEIKKAEKQLSQLQAQRPLLEDRLQAAQSALCDANKGEAAQQLQILEKRLSEMDYSLDDHNELRARLRQLRVWETRYQQLQQATVEKEAVLMKIERLATVCQDQRLALDTVNQQVEQFQAQLKAGSDLNDKIVELELEHSATADVRDQQQSRLGRLQQQLSQLESVEAQQISQRKTLEDIRHKYQVYRSLAEAFGRNGIQALMIENLLPQLEATTNQILGRLSDHQLHVQFVTQRAGRKKKTMIDTLDILIADARGTRPYETYSGGEAFRVNFAIRLAIARLLAMRSGTALQMLIVDEGFGTQDREGCDRLIAAIEAIAPDFACILTITHMPHFREAFQTRIDVSKDADGSRIVISG